jgi:hypothetical protein
MALLKPIVLNLPKRGACAVDYIDYFDEGHYGPDKPFFVNRFDDLDQVAAQMDKCLKLQTTPGSLIHGADGSTSLGRLDIEGKWVEPLSMKESKFPRRAYYKIRFLLRIKFYGEFAYIDLGAEWTPADLEDPSRIIVILPDDLKVVNRSMISEDDANWIRDEIVKRLTYTGVETYSPDGTSSPSSNELVEKYLAQKEEDEKRLSATYIFDDEYALSDDEGLLTIE